MAKELTETQLEYVEYRATPKNMRGTKKAFAEAHGVAETTLTRWEREPWFRAALDRRLAELNVDPDRLQEILDMLHREAKGGDVRAAQEYFKMVGDLLPPKPKPEDAAIANLTDEELDAAWEEGLAARKRARELA